MTEIDSAEDEGDMTMTGTEASVLLRWDAAGLDSTDEGGEEASEDEVRLGAREVGVLGRNWARKDQTVSTSERTEMKSKTRETESTDLDGLSLDRRAGQRPRSHRRHGHVGLGHDTLRRVPESRDRTDMHLWREDSRDRSARSQKWQTLKMRGNAPAIPRRAQSLRICTQSEP